MCGREELDPADRAELTFIVLANQFDTSTGPVPPVGTMVQCPMVGDVNVFLTERWADDDEGEEEAQPFTAVEMEIMIAEPGWRRKGLAKEALELFLHYISQEPTPHPSGADVSVASPFPVHADQMFARALLDNAPSIALFERVGFQRYKEVPVFNEVELRTEQPVTKAPTHVLFWPES